MGFEKKAIELMNRVLSPYDMRQNRFFESDSEIIVFNGQKLLFTMDEFSSEDLFREHDPFTLGWNIAAGGISDILAAGGTPLFYAHSVTAGEKWDENYIRRYAAGTAELLKKAGAGFIGGDFGRALDWRCTAAVIGKAEGKTVQRKGASPGDLIYLSGEAGMGNFEAAINIYTGNSKMEIFTGNIKNRFNLRIRESRLMRKYAACCMDTSDGVFNALNTLAESNHTGYTAGNIPYIKKGLVLAKLLNVPKTLLFIGECGEYELLFTLRPENEAVFLKDAAGQKLRFYKIGSIRGDPGIKTLSENGRTIDLAGFNIQARDFKKKKDYLREVMRWLEDQK